MLSQPIEEDELPALDPSAYFAEWKWDGIRVQLVARRGERRLYSRSGDEIGPAFPDILEATADDIALDGELLVIRDGEVAPFNDLQQRLNRKTPTPKMLADYPAAVQRLYRHFCASAARICARAAARRAAAQPPRFPGMATRRAPGSICRRWSRSSYLGRTPAALRDGARANGIEGLMLKRRDLRPICLAGRKARGSSGSAAR